MELPVEKRKRIAESSYMKDGEYYLLKEFHTDNVDIHILEMDGSAFKKMAVTYLPSHETYRSAMERLIRMTREYTEGIENTGSICKLPETPGL